MKSVVVGYAHKTIRQGRRLGRSILRAPIERQARQLADEAISRGSGSARIPNADGFMRLPAGSFSGASRVIPGLLELARSWKDDESRHLTKMPINILQTGDLFDHRAIVDLALHDEVLAAVSAYLKQVPRLYNLFLCWTPKNQSMIRSQLFHYDHRDSRQAKLFLNLDDVTEEAGPLHFLRASDSAKVDAKVGYKQTRYTDEQVYSAVTEDKLVAATGAAGSAYIVDTARCLHYGSRGNERERYLLMVSFARANSVNPGADCRVVHSAREQLAREYYPGDAVREFVLTSPS